VHPFDIYASGYRYQVEYAHEVEAKTPTKIAPSISTKTLNTVLI
jgi:hypothetical protein